MIFTGEYNDYQTSALTRRTSVGGAFSLSFHHKNARKITSANNTPDYCTIITNLIKATRANDGRGLLSTTRGTIL